MNDGSFSLGATSTSGLTLSYASSNTSIATVNSNGLVTLISGGTFQITMSAPANAGYFAASLTTPSITVVENHNYIANYIITNSVTVHSELGQIYADKFKFKRLPYIYNPQLVGDDPYDQIFAFQLTAKENQAEEFLGANNEGVYIWNPRFYNNEWWPRWSHEDEIASGGNNRCFMFYNMNNALDAVDSLFFRYNSYPAIGDGINARESAGFKQLTSTARSPGDIENFNITDQSIRLNGGDKPPVPNFGTFGGTFAQNFNVINGVVLNWNGYDEAADVSWITGPQIRLETNLQYDSMNNAPNQDTWAANGGDPDEVPFVKNDASRTATLASSLNINNSKSVISPTGPWQFIFPYGGSYTIEAAPQIVHETNIKTFDHFRISYSNSSVEATTSTPTYPYLTINVPGTIDSVEGEYGKGVAGFFNNSYVGSNMTPGHLPKIPTRITAMYKNSDNTFTGGPVLGSGSVVLPFDEDQDGDGVLNQNDALPYNPDEDADSDGDGMGDNEQAKTQTFIHKHWGFYSNRYVASVWDGFEYDLKLKTSNVGHAQIPLTCVSTSSNAQDTWGPNPGGETYTGVYGSWNTPPMVSVGADSEITFSIDPTYSSIASIRDGRYFQAAGATGSFILVAHYPGDATHRSVTQSWSITAT